MKAPRTAAAIPAAKPPTVILRPIASPVLPPKELEEPEEPLEDAGVEDGELELAEEEPPLEPLLELPSCKIERRKMSICRITRRRQTRTDNEVPHASL